MCGIAEIADEDLPRRVLAAWLLYALEQEDLLADQIAELEWLRQQDLARGATRIEAVLAPDHRRN
jgi:hypothetical protein